MAIKVVKFGGSSLADSTHFRLVASIVKSDSSRRYVIPSAPGKRFPEDGKVTDLLYACYDLIKKHAPESEIDAAYKKITDRYEAIIEELGLNFCIAGELEYVKNAMTHASGRDYAASRGEYLNGLILAKYLGFDFIDAENVIFFKENGTYDAEKTNAALEEELKQHEYAVIPGFYGVMPNQTIKTFSRGGSDITGSIVARAARADLYENWTDVSGVLMADPRVVPNPKCIDVITYRELRELSYMGATVLHEEAIFPVRYAGIPINIRNTNAPGEPGTLIVADADGYEKKNVITGLAGKKGFSIISLEKDMMNTEVGFGRKVLEVFEDYELPFEHLPSGIDTMCVVVATAGLEGKRERILTSIQRAVRPDRLSVTDGVALLAVVGRGMVSCVGVAAKVSTAIADAGINMCMIDQGSSEMSIIVGVKDEDLEKAEEAVYRAFVP